MTDTAERTQTPEQRALQVHQQWWDKQKKFRVRLIHGFHVEKDREGHDIMYSPNDVFLTTKPIFKRWQEKFQAVDEHVPLTPKGTRLLETGEDIEDEDDARLKPTQRMADPHETAPNQHGGRSDQGQVWPQGDEFEDEEGTPRRRRPLERRPEDMTVQELRAYAEEEEIDLGNASRKDEIVSVIKQAIQAT